jgi:PAS domain S-box-containing protein
MNTCIKDLPKYYLSLVDALPDSIFAIDMDGRVRIWNNAMEKITGRSARAMIDKGDYEYALPFYRSRRPVLLDLCLRPQLNISLNYNYVHKDESGIVAETTLADFGGRSAHLLLQAFPWYQNNRVIGAIEVIHEVAAGDRVLANAREGFIDLKEHYALLENKSIALKQVLELFRAQRQSLTEEITSKIKNDLIKLLRDISAKQCGVDKLEVDIVGQCVKEVGRYFNGLNDQCLYSLSPREGQIVQCIKQGMANKEIAKILDISRRSVETHRMRIRKKLGVSRSSTKNLTSFLQAL